MKIKQIINDITSNPSELISKYSERIPEGRFMFTHELIDEISNAITKKEGNLLEIILILIFRDGPDKNYTNILCQLLEENWHHSKEDIALMLEEIKDPKSIDYLYTTAINIPYHDDGRALARKCIWALAAISTPDAIAKLRVLKGNEDPIISEVAGDQLDS